MKRGVFIAIEGVDGAGKATQARLLAARLRAIGHDTEVISFPRYSQSSSYFIQKYLDGEYGPTGTISPYTASIFYAIDRFEAASNIRKLLDQGKIVIADRYTGSNMAHQGSKFSSDAQQRGFFIWLDNLEYKLFNIPRPDISMLLRVAIDVILMQNNNPADNHEKSPGHLAATAAVYDNLTKLFPKDFRAIECSKNRKMLDIATVSNQIWTIIKPFLPEHPPYAPKKMVLNLTEKTEKNKQFTEEKKSGHELIIIEKLSLLAARALMPIPSLSIKIGNLDWAQSEFSYYIPNDLPAKTLNNYKKSMNQLANQYKLASVKLGTHELMGLMPMAANVSAELTFASIPTANIMRQLASHPLDEVRQLTNTIAQKWPNLEVPKNATHKFNKPDNKQPSNDRFVEAVLVGVSPRNEFDLLPDILFEHNEHSVAQIKEYLDKVSYAHKLETLTEEIAISKQKVMNKICYKWELVCDFTTVYDLYRHGFTGEIHLQQATPFLGVSNLDDVDHKASAISEKLFSELCKNGAAQTSNYACLASYNSRIYLKLSAWDLWNQSMPASKQAKRLVNIMKEKSAELHPVTTNTNLDPTNQNPHSKLNNTNQSRSKRRRRKKS